MAAVDVAMTVPEGYTNPCDAPVPIVPAMSWAVTVRDPNPRPEE